MRRYIVISLATLWLGQLPSLAKAASLHGEETAARPEGRLETGLYGQWTEDRRGDRQGAILEGALIAKHGSCYTMLWEESGYRSEAILRGAGTLKGDKLTIFVEGDKQCWVSFRHRGGVLTYDADGTNEDCIGDRVGGGDWLTTWNDRFRSPSSIPPQNAQQAYRGSWFRTNFLDLGRFCERSAPASPR